MGPAPTALPWGPSIHTAPQAGEGEAGRVGASRWLARGASASALLLDGRHEPQPDPDRVDRREIADGVALDASNH